MNWLDIARNEIGQKEYLGFDQNPRIVEYHSCTTLSAITDEVAWCSSFLNWVFKQAGMLGTRSAAAKSWLLWGKEIEKPIPGCVVVQNHHVGLFIKEVPFFVLVLGGNQGDQVKESWFKKSSVISYRWPIDEGPSAA
jgi:uncharacterized protein (TIGR02594 family)